MGMGFKSFKGCEGLPFAGWGNRAHDDEQDNGATLCSGRSHPLE